MNDDPHLARSARLFAEASRLIPGGVNSPVRAFRAVGGTPRFISRGNGAHIEDADGNRLIDYVLSWGALPLGHADPDVVRAIGSQAALGTSFGAPTELESELAGMITAAIPAVEMVRFVSSGTEAVMSALRLARAATGRQMVLKFRGCYHGHSDAMLVEAGSGAATLGLPNSPGVTTGSAADTLTARFNELDDVRRLVTGRAGSLAAIIVEPVAGNMGLVLPEPGFLAGLRSLADDAGALLIFDEVMTGFRVAYGGAQGRLGITPDLTCLGKVIGGGLPAAAFGGRRDVMSQLAPLGPVYQAGTLSGNPLAMTAGITTLRRLRQPGAYDQLERAASQLAEAVAAEAGRCGVPVQTAAIGGMWGFHMCDSPVRNFESAAPSDRRAYGKLFHAMLGRGVYLPPSALEAAFVSTRHDDEVIAATQAAFASAFAELSLDAAPSADRQRI